MWHLFEVVIINSRIWLKVQASCESSEQAAAFFEYRFTGTEYTTVDGERPVTPFKLSKRSHYIANWDSIVDRLPAGWDDEEFHIGTAPYAWCETLSPDCDCYAAKGSLHATYCSDFGLHDEAGRRASKSTNVRYLNVIRTMEETIVRRDSARRLRRLQTKAPSLPDDIDRTPVPAPVLAGDRERATGPLRRAIHGVERLVAPGFYCSIEERHHPYGEQAIRKTIASLTAAVAQVSNQQQVGRHLALSRIDDIVAHWLQVYQCEDCAQKALWGDVDIPEILYKYIPRERIGKGAPNSLRATQILALNDDMECNVITMRSSAEENTLPFLATVQARIEKHLNIAVPWETVLTQALRYGTLRLSAFIQEYLNPLVGVVSFSTDILAPGHDVGSLRTEYRDSRGLRDGGAERPRLRTATSNLLRNRPHVPTFGRRSHQARFCQSRGHGARHKGRP